MYKILGYCALPECGRAFTIRHGLCCCKSHRAEYSRRKGKGTLDIIPERISLLEREKIKNNIIKSEKKFWIRTAAHRECVRKYQAKKRQAFPKWADREKIKEIYNLAEEKTQSSGIIHEVDHIVPLAGKNVCGLHNEHNLQVLTKEENRKKTNNFT